MIERASDLPENDQNTRIKLESDERRKDGKALTKSIKRRVYGSLENSLCPLIVGSFPL